MKKVLLSVASLGLMLSANAQQIQNFKYGFEEGDKLNTRIDLDGTTVIPGTAYYENWSEFANSSHNAEYTEDKASGLRSLFVETDTTITEGWKRVIAYDNMGLKEKTSYRVTFMLKGEGQLNVALLKGCFNHDKALVSGTGTSYNDQTTTIEFKNTSWKRESFLFWAPSRETMSASRQATSWLSEAAKMDFENDTIWAQDFLRFGYLGKGKYTIDDIVVEESSIKGISFNGKKLCVDFGYAINLNEYTAQNSCVTKEKFTVNVNGSDVEVASVEALREDQEDGSYTTRLVIFTKQNIANNATVKVSYKNEVGKLIYTTTTAPFSFEEPNRTVLDFSEEPAYYDASLKAISLSDMGAIILNTTPANKDMEIDPATTEFKFTFNQPVLEDDEEEFGKPIAKLDGVDLTLVGLANGDSTLVFKRTSTEALAKGQHTLTISNVTNVYGIPSVEKDLPETMFEVGAITDEDLARDDINKLYLCYDYDNDPSDKNGSSLPTAAMGWRHINGGNLIDWGVGRNGTGGLLNVNTSFKRGLYIRLPNSDLTQFGYLYGCWDDVEGAPALTLDEGELQLSYEVIGWDGAKPNTYFMIYSYKENAEYTEYLNNEADILNKKVTCQEAATGSVAGTSEKVTVKISVPKTGRYVIRLAADGQAVFGNIRIEKVGSITLMNRRLLIAALTPAEEELAIANGDEKFVGTTRTNLANAVKYAKETILHTEADYAAAIADLEKYTKAMQTRRSNLEAYASKLEALQLALSEVATQFLGTEAYSNAVNKESYYRNINPVSLEDDALADAVTGIGTAAEFLSNTINVSTPNLTKQMTELAAAIVKLNAERENDAVILETKTTITDAQSLVALLKTLYVGTLYQQIAEGKDFFHYNTQYEDGENMRDTVLADSIDVSFMIQNRQFYTTSGKMESATYEDYPGWTLSSASGSKAQPLWGWESGAWKNNCPVVDVRVSTGWGTQSIDVQQTVEGLPAGTYTPSIQVGDGTSKDKENNSFAYFSTDEKSDTVTVINDGGNRALKDYKTINVTPNVDAKSKTASLVIGAQVNCSGDFATIDNAKLYMTAKVADFDYAAAAQQLLNEYNGINETEIAGTPVSVTYINLAGQHMTAPQGVSLKVERMSNGMTVVKKVIVK